MRYVFGDTLIVRNLEIARKLGIGTARFVTIDGDLADMSGSMTGGFRGKQESRISISNLSEKLEKIEDEMSSISEMIMKSDKKRAEHEELLNARKIFKSELEGDIIKGEKALHLAGTDLDAEASQEKELKPNYLKFNKTLKE
jgi:chromosome segregation ATPase